MFLLKVNFFFTYGLLSQNDSCPDFFLLTANRFKS